MRTGSVDAFCASPRCSRPTECRAYHLRHWELPEEVDPRKSLFVTGDVNVGRDPSNVNVWGNMTLTGIVDLTAGADPDETILVRSEPLSIALWSAPLSSAHSQCRPKTEAEGARIAAPGRQRTSRWCGLREWNVDQCHQSQRDASRWTTEAVNRCCGG